VSGTVSLVRLGIEPLPRLVEVAQRYGLDFDDAYQYVSAEENGYILVGFDKGFDRTPLGRKTPAEVLEQSES